MSNLYRASAYKNKIISLLLNNDNFIKLVNPTITQGLTTQQVMLGGEYPVDGKLIKEQGHLFDYNFVDDTVTQEKTFVFVETDIDTVRENLFTDFHLYVYIFTDKKLVKITDESVPTADEVKNMGYFAGYYGNRVDILCDIVDRELNGTDKLKGISDVDPSPKEYLTIYTPKNGYYGKRLKYKVTSYNEAGNAYGN